MQSPGRLDLTPHERLLLACVRATRDGQRLRAASQASDLDWPAFWELAQSQHIGPLVARVIAQEGLLDATPPAVRAALVEARLETIVQNFAAQSELAAISARLKALGIPLMPLKGVELAARVFGELDARRCGDIDILVREEDWATAHAALLDIGYRPITTPRPGIQQHSFHGVPLARAVNGRRYVVELHHRLTDPRFSRIDHAALWRGALAGGMRADGCVALPDEELLLFLALHLHKHDAGLLRLLADIDHLIVRHRVALDWARVLALAAEWNVETLLYFALASSATLLGTPVPASARRDLQPARWRRMAVGALAGPRAILRPPTAEQARASRFRIAYCLMLAPAGTALRAYHHYVLAPPTPTPARTRATGEALAGAARTVLATAQALHDLLRAGPRVECP